MHWQRKQLHSLQSWNNQSQPVVCTNVWNQNCISMLAWEHVKKMSRISTRHSATAILTLQPNDEQACSMFSRIYQYYWHSTNHSRSFDQQSATTHQPSSETNGTSGKRRLTKLNGLVSAAKVNILRLLNLWKNKLQSNQKYSYITYSKLQQSFCCFCYIHVLKQINHHNLKHLCPQKYKLSWAVLKIRYPTVFE